MEMNDESYNSIGEFIKTTQKQIDTLKNEIQIINEELIKPNNSSGKYNLELKASVAKLNQIAAIQFHIRSLEENIHEFERQRTLIENNHLYKLRLSINPNLGQIEFYYLSKGKGSNILFKYDGANLIKVKYEKSDINDSGWFQYGNKSILKSVISIFDKKYILQENGDFVIIDKTCNNDEYRTNDVVGNVLNFDKMLSGNLFS